MKPQIKFINIDKTQFFNTLKERVDNYFFENNISQHANFNMVLKTVFMLCLYFVPYFLIMTQGFSQSLMWILTLVMGLGLAGIGMGVMHDANHGAYSSNPIINKLFSVSLSLVGGDNKNWKTQHNVLHHTYTNIYGHDKDIDDKGLMRLSPESKHKKFQKFQVAYVFVLYSSMTLYWTTLKDFVQYFAFIKEGHNKESGVARLKSFFTILVWKLFYWGYIIVLPTLLLDLKLWQVLLGFLSMHIVAGLLLSIVFQLAHVVEETQFPVRTLKVILKTNGLSTN